MLNNDLAVSPRVPDNSTMPVAAQEQRKKIAQAAEGFEAQFIREMFKQARNATREIAGKDSGADSSMTDMADAAVADALASQRLFGVAHMVQEQLSRSAVGNIHVNQNAVSAASDE